MLKNKRRIRLWRSGQSTVEFALILPILAMLLVGVIDLGSLISAHNEVVIITRQAARTLASEASLASACASAGGCQMPAPCAVSKSSDCKILYDALIGLHSNGLPLSGLNYVDIFCPSSVLPSGIATPEQGNPAGCATKEVCEYRLQAPAPALAGDPLNWTWNDSNGAPVTAFSAASCPVDTQSDVGYPQSTRVVFDGGANPQLAGVAMNYSFTSPVGIKRTFTDQTIISLIPAILGVAAQPAPCVPVTANGPC